MMQINEYVDVESKIADKIMQIENRQRKQLTDAEKKIAHELFMSGFLFGVQWCDNKSFR